MGAMARRLSGSYRDAGSSGFSLPSVRPKLSPMPTLTSITAPTGTALSCKGWHQEAALRVDADLHEQ